MKKILQTILLVLSLTFIPISSMLLHAAPKIIAHAGGEGNWPKNTLFAFLEAKRAGVYAIELDVQVSKDRQVMVYHGNNLSIWSNGSGTVASLNAEVIQKFSVKCSKNIICPKDTSLLKIPTLNEVLEKVSDIPIFIDMKSVPEKDLSEALAKTIPKKEWKRLIFYSTNKSHYDYLTKAYPAAVIFEDRDTTRNRAVKQLLTGETDKIQPQAKEAWIAFELVRQMTVFEKFNLGEGKGTFNVVVWNKDTVATTRNAYKKVNLMFFGINNKKLYDQATALGADAVFTNNPLDLIKK